MSFALSSIVRTRQKLFFLFILTLFFCPLFPPSGVQASESSASSVASPNSVGRGAGEFDNIDSFDVHPLNRWTVTNNGFTSTISSGVLNSSDTGDGTADSYRIARALRDLDGTVEMRFLLVGGAGDGGDNFLLRFYDTNDPDRYNRFLVLLDGVGNQVVRLDMQSEDGYKNKDLGVTEGVTVGLWYRLRLDYDILQSTFRYRMFFDNGSKVFDYSIIDVSLSRPKVFNATSVSMWITTSIKSNGTDVESLVDYVNAPFKEREWTHTVDDNDANLLVGDNPFLSHSQDDVDVGVDEWSLVVPYLDSLSFLGKMEFDDLTSLADNGEFASLSISVDIVDSTDGSLDTAFWLYILLGKSGGTEFWEWEFFGDGIGIDGGTLSEDTDTLWISGTVNTMEDRSVLSGSMGVGKSFDDTQPVVSGFDDVLASDVSANPSQEFVIRIIYSHVYTGDTECHLWFDSINILKKSITKGVPYAGDEVVPTPDDSGSNGINLGIFQGFFDAIGAIISFFLGPIIDFIQDLIAGITEIAAGVWSALGDSLDFITDAIAGIWAFLIATLDDLLAGLVLLAEDIGDFLFAVIEFLLVLIVDIVAELWTVIETTIFFVWDALGLPNLIGLFNELLVYIIELIGWTLTTFQDVIVLAADLSWIILVAWWIWALPIQWARAGGNPLAGIGNFIEVYFYDLIPWTVVGVHVYVPQGIAATLWVILLLPETFILFTALGI